MATVPTNGTKWWQTWLPMIAASIMVISYFSTFFGQQGSQSTTITQLQTNVNDLERRLGKSESALQAQQIANAVAAKNDCQQFAKIETQFGTVQTIVNEMHVSDIRERGLLEQKVLGIQPTSVYYPVEIPHEVTPCQ